MSKDTETPAWFEEWIRHSQEINTGIANELYSHIKRVIEHLVRPYKPKQDNHDRIYLDCILQAIRECTRAETSRKILDRYWELSNSRIQEHDEMMNEIETSMKQVDIGDRLRRQRKNDGRKNK